MRYLFAILVSFPLFLQAQYSADARYMESPGEYTMFFKRGYALPGLAYAVTTDNTVAGTGNTGAQGIATQVAIPGLPNKMMAIVCTGLHDGGMASADSGRVFMGGLPTNCQLGNGLTTGPSTMYEILTDVNGNQFYGITAMSAGWGPVSSVPFYCAIESDTGHSVWVWGNGTNLGLGSCIKPTPLPLPGSRHPHKIYAMNSSIHCIATDGTLWVRGGTDDNAANTGVNATPTTWTQVTIPGGAFASFMCKGNNFAFVVTTAGDLISFGQFGWLCKNQATSAFSQLTTPTNVNSFFPSSIFPIDTMVAAHVGYLILNNSNGLFTGGSNEVGICGTGPSIYWPTYTGAGGFMPWEWDFGMGQYVNQCTQIAKGANLVWNKLFGGPLYSLYFLVQDTAGGRHIIGRGKVFPTGLIFADSTGGRISSLYPMGHNALYMANIKDYFAITTSTVASSPGCATGAQTGMPCSWGTDAPSRPNTNLHCHLALTPIAGGFNWSIATSTTDASHKIIPELSFIVQSGGPAQSIGVPAGVSGSVIGISPGTTISITDTMIDNSFDTVTDTKSITIGQSHLYVSSSAGSDANSGTIGSPFATEQYGITQCVYGDTLSLKSGDTFNETFRSITGVRIDTYGGSAYAVNTGFITLSSWTSIGNGIYEAFVAGDRANLNCVTVDGNLTKVGTYPDTGYVTYTGLSSTTLTAAAISIFPYTFVNGTVCIRDEFSNIDSLHTTAQGSNTLTLASPPSILGGRGNGFFIMNHPNTLLTTLRVGAYYNNVAKDSLQMFFGVAGPSGHVVKIAMIDTLSSAINDSTVSFNKIDFEGANQFSILENITSNISYDSCKFRYCGNYWVRANNNTHSIFLVDSVQYVNNTGAYATGSSTYPLFLNLYMDSVGMTAGMGQTGASQGYTGICWGNFYGGILKYSTISHVGFNGIYFSGDSNFIHGNYIHHYCMVKSDGSGIYNWDGSLIGYTYGHLEDSNIVMNGGNAGGGIVYNQADMSFSFYSDGRSSRNNFINNTGAFNPSAGGYNKGSSNTITGNNWYGNLFENFRMEEGSGVPVTNITYKRNTHGYTGVGPRSISFITPGNDLNLFCLSCDTNYYLAPGGQSATMYTQSSSDAGTYRTLASWQTDLGIDVHSSYINGALILISTVSGGTFPLGGNYKDAVGNQYSSIVLPSYSSKILYSASCNCIILPVGSKPLVN